MTLANFILALRARLQDLYTSQGVKIVSATSDGIRWTSSELIEVVNSATSEFSRLFITYPKSPLFEKKSSTIISIPKEGNVTNGTMEVTDKTVFSVLSLKKRTGESYGYISPENYTTYLSEDKSPRLNSLFFTEMVNESKNKVIMTIPQSSEEVVYVYILSKGNYTSSDIDLDIGFDGFLDMLLDLCERECRDREHNWDRSTILTKRILYKIGMSNE